jgi:hypothetical protein
MSCSGLPTQDGVYTQRASYGLSLVDAPGVLARGIWLAVSRVNGASPMPDEPFLRNGPS